MRLLARVPQKYTQPCGFFCLYDLNPPRSSLVIKGGRCSLLATPPVFNPLPLLKGHTLLSPPFAKGSSLYYSLPLSKGGLGRVHKVAPKTHFPHIDSEQKFGIYKPLTSMNFLLQQNFVSVNSMLTISCYKQFC